GPHRRPSFRPPPPPSQLEVDVLEGRPANLQALEVGPAIEGPRGELVQHLGRMLGSKLQCPISEGDVAERREALPVVHPESDHRLSGVPAADRRRRALGPHPPLWRHPPPLRPPPRFASSWASSM